MDYKSWCYRDAFLGTAESRILIVVIVIHYTRQEKCRLNFPDFIVFDLDPYIYSGTEKKGQGARIQPERIQGDSGGGLLSERPSFRTKNQIFCRNIRSKQDCIFTFQ